jgi:hypothetical protein
VPTQQEHLQQGAELTVRTGYYSIIQFCPNLARHEVVNVGVVLFCPGLSYLDALVSEDNSRICKFFGAESFDSARVTSYKQGVVKRLRLERDNFKSLKDLEEFAASRAGFIQLTKPLAVTVVVSENDLQQLFDELVR